MDSEGQNKEEQMVKRRAYLYVAAVVVLFLLGTPIFAQEKGGAGYFVGGVGWFLEYPDTAFLYSAGGGGHIITDKWLIGGEGHSSFGSENAGGYGFFNVGYLVVKKDFVMVYPMLGLGGGSMTSTATSEVSACALLNPAVGVDFLIPVKDSSGILLGLRGGFMFTIHHNETFDWSMPHIRLLIGGYGFEE
jgi:hypothetical protein